MKRLGKVLHVSSSGNMVVQADKAPAIGSVVVNEKIEEVGLVYDVIGPTSRPYVVVRPKEDVDAKSYVGRSLYIRTEDKKQAKKAAKSTTKASKQKAP